MTTNPRLPDKATFLATGLQPAKPTDTDCTVCLEPYNDPVLLPCNHIFDRACITTYLSTITARQGQNTCPLCRRVLFSMPPLSQPYLRPHVLVQQTPLNPTQRALFDRAERVSNISIAAMRRGELESAETFGFELTAPGAESLRYAFAAVVHFLFRETMVSRTWNGDVLGAVRLAVLEPRIVVLGNVLPLLAALQGREYLPEHLATWRSLLNLFPPVLRAIEGEECAGTELPQRLRRALTARARQVQADEAVLNVINGVGQAQLQAQNDSETLLNCVAWSCVDERAQEQESTVAARHTGADGTQRARVMARSAAMVMRNAALAAQAGDHRASYGHRVADSVRRIDPCAVM